MRVSVIYFQEVIFITRNVDEAIANRRSLRIIDIYLSGSRAYHIVIAA